MARLSLKVLAVLSLSLFVATATPSQATVIDAAIEGGVKQLAKTSLKKVIPGVNVFTTTYEAAQFAMDSIEIADVVGSIIIGVARDQPWAVARAEVLFAGVDYDADTGADRAFAVASIANIFGDSAFAQAAVTRANNPSIFGSSTSGRRASWLGLAGVGGNVTIKGSDVIGSLVLTGVNQLLDPPFAPPLGDLTSTTSDQHYNSGPRAEFSITGRIPLCHAVVLPESIRTFSWAAVLRSGDFWILGDG